MKHSDVPVENWDQPWLKPWAPCFGNGGLTSERRPAALAWGAWKSFIVTGEWGYYWKGSKLQY